MVERRLVAIGEQDVYLQRIPCQTFESEEDMNVYHIWCNLKDGVKNLEFADAVKRYFEHLKERGQVRGEPTWISISPTFLHKRSILAINLPRFSEVAPL